jgi:hypothetical protein
MGSNRPQTSSTYYGRNLSRSIDSQENNSSVLNSIKIQSQLEELKKSTINQEVKQILDRRVRKMRISDYFTKKSTLSISQSITKNAAH